MVVLRRFVGMVGLGLLGIGFYSLYSAITDTVNGFAFRFASVADAFADTGLSVALPAGFGDIPAFFTLVPLGALLAWWGMQK